MSFSKIQGTCTGRGFSDTDSDGYLKNLYDFVDGHDDWHILLDRSSQPSSIACTGTDGSAETVAALSHGLITGEEVVAIDTGNGLPYRITNGNYYRVEVVDSDTLKLYYNFENYLNSSPVNLNTETIDFEIALKGPYIVVGNKEVPTDENDPVEYLEIGYLSNISGYVYAHYLFGFNPSTNYCAGRWSGFFLPTLDSSPFVFDFRANEHGLFYIQSLIEGDWKSGGIDSFTPLTGYLEPSSILGTVQNSATIGTDVVLQLSSSTEADLFTKGNFYYTYDFRQGSNLPVNYAECTGVGVADGLNADEIKLDQTYFDIDPGAKVTPYAHTWVSYGAGLLSNAGGYSRDLGTGKLPYYSIRATSEDPTESVRHNQDGNAIAGSFIFGYEQQVLESSAPDDKGLYTVQRPLVVEASDAGGNVEDANRAYGEIDNIWLCKKDNLSVMQVGRYIDGNKCICVGDDFHSEPETVTGIYILMADEA
jgi:hypothetical protein